MSMNKKQTIPPVLITLVLAGLMLFSLSCYNAGMKCEFPDEVIIKAENREGKVLPAPDTAGNAVKAVRFSSFFVTDGVQSLELECAFNGEKGTLPLALTGKWPGVHAVLLDVYSDLSAPSELKGYVQAGKPSAQLQSNRVVVNPGKNNDLRLCINPGWFKTEKNNTELTRKIFSLELKSSRGVTGKLFIDNIRLACSDEDSQPAVLPAAPAATEDSSKFGITLLTKDITETSHLLYRKLEIDCATGGTIKNPYDPQEISLDGVFAFEDKEQYTVPGFYYVPFTRTIRGGRDIFRPAGEGFWKVRFTPDKAGEWSFHLTASGSNGTFTTSEINFTVIPAESDGFIRQPAEGERYFHYSSGTIYLPVGANVAWYDMRETSSYMNWFYRMGKNGANYARLWLASWGFEFEWKDTGLGDYTDRQTRAWQLDYTLQLAEEAGIRIMLCLLNHGRFSTSTNPEWNGNPYNRVNGGPLENPWEFLTNPEAKKIFRQKLRYLVARWGYSTSLFSWELWNEVNLADKIADNERFVPWINEMTAYLRSIDPYKHPVSSSFSTSITGNELSWKNLDYVQIHKYNIRNWAGYINSLILNVRKNTDKPVLLSEFGIQGDIIDPGGIHFHNGLWAGLFSGSAGTGMLWWWDKYIDSNNLYYHYRGVSRFFEKEDPGQDGLEPAEMERVGKAEVYRLSGRNKALVWIKNREYSYGGSLDNAMSSGNLDKVVFSQVTAFDFSLPGMSPGRYRIEKWYPSTGEREKSSEQVFNDIVRITVDPFETDVAYKILPVEKQVH